MNIAGQNLMHTQISNVDSLLATRTPPPKNYDGSSSNVFTKEVTRYGMRQHALLNLSRMHYLQHEHTAARKFLTEAIEISRLAGDKETLQHCQGLLHRLPTKHKDHKPVINEIQPGLHPIEVLFDVEKLLRVNSVSRVVLT